VLRAQKLSELKPQAELHYALRSLRCRNLTQRPTGSDVARVGRNTEIRMIKHLERFPSELQF